MDQVENQKSEAVHAAIVRKTNARSSPLQLGPAHKRYSLTRLQYGPGFSHFWSEFRSIFGDWLELRSCSSRLGLCRLLPEVWTVQPAMVLAQCEGDGATEGAVAGNAKLLPGWVEFDPCDPCVILWYLLVNILATSVCPVPIAGAMTAISAVLFGLVPGMAITTTSSLIGAYLGHLAVRHLCRPCFMRSLGRYHEHWRALDTAISQAGATQIALLMRLSPMFPMVANNILLSLTTISTWTYMWTCAAGVIPSNLPYAYAAELGVSLHNHEDPIMVTMTVLGLLASVAFAWKLGVIAKQLLQQHGVGEDGESSQSLTEGSNELWDSNKQDGGTPAVARHPTGEAIRGHPRSLVPPPVPPPVPPFRLALPVWRDNLEASFRALSQMGRDCFSPHAAPRMV